MLPDSSAAFYRAQQRRQRATLLAVRREWARMGPDFDQSWRTVGPRTTVLLSAAQQGAAVDGVNYMTQVLAETGQTADLDAQPNPRRLAGVASDGRPLDTLLYSSVTTAKQAIATGVGTDEALEQGGSFLDMATRTQVADAGRGGFALSMFARPNLTGYVRMVNPPCCSRCAILAGKYFRTNSGFQRHPRCDCVHIPSAENIAGDFTTDPRKLLAGGRITDISKADRTRLDSGDSLQSVVNDKRMQFRNTQIEELYANAPSRRYAIRVLRERGFLT